MVLRDFNLMIKVLSQKANVKRAINLFRLGFLRPFGTGGGFGSPLSLCNLKTAYAMATKFAQDSVRANSHYYRYCDVTVT